MGWFKKFGNSDWWFGEHSMFGSALDTASKKGLKVGEWSLDAPDPKFSLSNPQITSLALIGVVVLLIANKNN